MNKRATKDFTQVSELSIPAFGYELIREELIDDLLGRDSKILLYWAGKRLARKYPLFSLEEIYEFFQKAGWGTLELIEQKRDKLEFTLTSELIQNRLRTKMNTNFQLEAGFLAEQIQQQRKVYAEAYEHPKKRDGVVSFTVKWDAIPFDL